MSSLLGSNIAIPYQAPWVASWNRFPAQYQLMKKNGTSQYVVTIPSAQWWRVVSTSFQYVSSAAAAARIMRMTFDPPDAGQTLLPAPAAQAVSLSTWYTFGIGLTPFATTPSGGFSFQTMTLFDMLWPQGTLITISVGSDGAGDSWNVVPTLLTELYTEHVDDTTGTPVLIPSPVLS